MGGSSTDLGWHWGLAIGDENACYEVAGSMAVIGPNGILAASSPLATNIKPTHLRQYDAFLSLQLPLRPEPAVLQVGVPHRQVRPWTRAPPIDAVDQAREAALLTLLAHRLRVSPHSMGQLWEGCFLVLTELEKKLTLKKC